MKFYLKELQEKNKEKLLIKRLKESYPNLNFYYYEEALWCASLVVRDNEDHFINQYQLTNYNVVKTTYNASRINSFGEIISTDSIRKIYIQFMKKTFPNYREDYLKACEKTALTNLGELNTDL